jgi:hypothetical protein
MGPRYRAVRGWYRGGAADDRAGKRFRAHLLYSIVRPNPGFRAFMRVVRQRRSVARGSPDEVAVTQASLARNHVAHSS